jgi:hypothetical protein
VVKVFRKALKTCFVFTIYEVKNIMTEEEQTQETPEEKPEEEPAEEAAEPEAPEEPAEEATEGEEKTE